MAERFCQEAGFESFHLVGHSLGGYLALAAAATQILPLRSLLLIDGGLNPIAVPQEVGPMAYLVPTISRLDRLLGGRIIARRPGPPATIEPTPDPQAVADRLHESGYPLVSLSHASLVAPSGPRRSRSGR